MNILDILEHTADFWSTLHRGIIGEGERKDLNLFARNLDWVVPPLNKRTKGPNLVVGTLK